MPKNIVKEITKGNKLKQWVKMKYSMLKYIINTSRYKCHYVAHVYYIYLCEFVKRKSIFGWGKH